MSEQQWQWFTKGDIILLEKGMVVEAWIPEKYTTCHSFANRVHLCKITIGQSFHNEPISKKDLVKKIYYRLHDGFTALYGVEIDFKSIFDFVDSLSLDFTPSSFDTSALVGAYVVGDNNSTVIRSYPSTIENTSKWFHCRKLDNPDIEVYICQNKEFMEKFPNCKLINRKV